MDADPRGYYAALHVTPAATQADIQRAFRALIRLHHPDVGSPGPQGGGADVRSILDAFAVLRNPVARAEYDRNGRTPDSGAASGARGTDGPAERGGRPADPPAPAGARDIPVRHHPGRGPVLRVTPVRWERGPWKGRS
jgi:DnaJ-class molecular chaperone